MLALLAVRPIRAAQFLPSTDSEPLGFGDDPQTLDAGAGWAWLGNRRTVGETVITEFGGNSSAGQIAGVVADLDAVNTRNGEG